MYRDANFRDLRQSGTTSDGRPVVAGVFAVVNSEGVGLDVLLELFHDRRLVVDWIDFLRHARAFGWNLRTAAGKIHAAVEQVEGPQVASAWLERAHALIAAWTDPRGDH